MIYLNLGQLLSNNVLCLDFSARSWSMLCLDFSPLTSTMKGVPSCFVFFGTTKYVPLQIIIIRHFDCLGCKISKPQIFISALFVYIYLPSRGLAILFLKYISISMWTAVVLGKNSKSVKIVIKVKILGTKQWHLRIFS